jgi:hypothetical protein
VKYKLETIPVWDAYQAQTECPLCLLQRKAEEGYVRFFLGNSVMVPEMRVQVNETGFCPSHYTMLMGGGNRLGLALITHTHIQELRKRMEPGLGSAKAGGGLKKEIIGLNGFLTDQLSRCMICNRLEERFKRYAFTIVHLWGHEEEFRAAFGESRGFCLDHQRGLAEMAVETLRGAPLAEFIKELKLLQTRAWDRLEEELLRFTGKFDYQADGRVTAETKESVADAIQKLTGADVPRE